MRVSEMRRKALRKSLVGQQRLESVLVHRLSEELVDRTARPSNDVHPPTGVRPACACSADARARACAAEIQRLLRRVVRPLSWLAPLSRVSTGSPAGREQLLILLLLLLLLLRLLLLLLLRLLRHCRHSGSHCIDRAIDADVLSAIASTPSSQRQPLPSLLLFQRRALDGRDHRPGVVRIPCLLLLQLVRGAVRTRRCSVVIGSP